jgi:hypothetical protein
VRQPGSSRPSEYSVPLLGFRRHRRRPSSRSCLPVQSPNPPKFRPYWLDDPALPLAVSSALRFSLGRARGAQSSDRTNLSSGFCPPPEYYPADPSRPAGADRLLSWASDPFSTHRISEVHSPQVCRTCYVPPLGFGYPLGGLLPPSPSRFCLTPGALLGLTLRSIPLSQGIPAFPRGRTHIPFNLPLLPPPRRWAGPTGRGFWASTLARVPGGRARR